MTTILPCNTLIKWRCGKRRFPEQLFTGDPLLGAWTQNESRIFHPSSGLESDDSDPTCKPASWSSLAINVSTAVPTAVS